MLACCMFFIVLQGKSGRKGNPGPRGDKGVKGDDGPPGKIGFNGPIGKKVHVCVYCQLIVCQSTVSLNINFSLIIAVIIIDH